MDKGKWAALAAKTHQDQAVWFLNAFWNAGVKEKAEDLWDWCLKVCAFFLCKMLFKYLLNCFFV